MRSSRICKSVRWILKATLVPAVAASAIGLAAENRTRAKNGEGASDLPVLTKVAEARDLPLEEAVRGYPVHLTGLVVGRLLPPTYVVQDETGAIPVTTEGRPNALWPGQLIELEGVSDPGLFAPKVIARKATVKGTAPLPAPVKLTMEDLAFGKARAEYGELRGIVRAAEWDSVNRLVELHVAVGTSRLQVFVFEPAQTNCLELVDAVVRLRGVVTSRFNQQRQWLGARLNVTTLTNVFVEQPSRLDSFDSPLFPISSLAQSDAARAGTEFSSGHRVKTRGVVTYFTPRNLLFIQDEDSGLEVRIHDSRPVTVGEEIEVVGFPAAGVYAPLLEDALYRRTGEGVNIRPQIATAGQLLNGHFEAELVTIDARLLSTMHRRGDDLLVLKADNLFFSASLRSGDDKESSVAGLPEGTQIRLTGICQTVEASERMGVDYPILSPASVRLLLRSPQDLTVLRRPSWWTPRRLVLALAGMSSLGLAAAAWIWSLRRRVRKQTEIILEKVQRGTVLEERSRIAREWHDTVEQGLAGVALQLDLVNFKLLERSESAAPPLDLARRMVRHCQTEARRSIWDLRCAALETGDLTSALNETLKPLIEGHELTLRVEVRGKARRLRPLVENDLLRIGQEAVTNAVRHSQAHQITIVLEFAAQSVQMTVSDDGCGFNPKNPALVLSGHFGLAGMEERATKLGGQLVVDSAPGAGTRIRVSVPAEKTRRRNP